MESKANYAIIGAFVLFVIVFSIGFVAWYSNSQFDRQYDEYDVVFTGPVRGLSPGGEVRYIGLKVGEVVRLHLDDDDNNKVIAQIRVDSTTPVHTDSYAQLEPLGLTGLNLIQIFAGDEGVEVEKQSYGSGIRRDRHKLEGRGSTFDTILGGGTTLIDAASLALGNVNNLISPPAVADLHNILKNLEVFTGKLAEVELDAETVEQLTAVAIKTAEDISLAANAIEKGVSDMSEIASADLRDLLSRAQQSLAVVDNTLLEYGTLGTETTKLVTDARDALNRFSSSGVTDAEEALDEIRVLSQTLNRIADNLEQSPLGFVAGEERETLELPQ